MITVYNGERFLAEAVDSALGQTHQPLEVVVVDDGSTDGSGEVARRYGDTITYEYQPNGGIGAARNQAVQLAAGRFFAFLDADDRFRPDKIERQLAVLDSDPSVDMVFGHLTEFLSPDVDERAAAQLRQPVHDQPWRMPNLMLVTREAFERVGLFSTELRVGIGVDWYARAMECGLKELVLPSIVLERRLHASNNGIRQRDVRHQYLHVLKASVDRRRRLAERDDR